MLRDLLKASRSYRRFDANVQITEDHLRRWVDLVRFCPSGRNAQPLKYRMVTGKDVCAAVFGNLSWAGYLTDWAGPEETERPVAYLIQLLDTRISGNQMCDDGIQLQTLLLGAAEEGFGGCIIKTFKNEPLRNVLQLPEEIKILYVLALGKPVETVVLEEMKGEDFKYWRSPDHVHHVPKRPLSELLF